jgi:predicted phage-related endonuclease
MTLQEFGQYTLDRSQGIGGSDVPIIVGMSPYRAPIDLWNEKIGNSIEREESLAQLLGKMLEDGIAKVYAAQEKVRLRKRTLPYGLRFIDASLAPDPVFTERFGFPTWAQIDRERVGDPVIRAVEVKHTASFYRFSEGVPDDVQVQVQHALMLTGWKAAHVVSLTGGRTLRVDTIEADAEVHLAIATACREFWQRVVLRQEPEPDGSDSSGRYLRSKFSDVEPGKVIVATPDMKPMLAELLDARARADEAAKQYEAAKQRVMRFMEDAERIEAAGGLKITWKKPKSGSKSWKAIASDLKRLIADDLDVPNLKIGDELFSIEDAFEFIESMHTSEPERRFDVRGKVVGL